MRYPAEKPDCAPIETIILPIARNFLPESAGTAHIFRRSCYK
jgi:hypothetical protein